MPADRPVTRNYAATPVNSLSNAIDPRKKFPLHVEHLMRHLENSGQQPQQWLVLDAHELRLDENGMEVEFTLVQHGTNCIWRRRVLVGTGRLLAIRTV